jgi:hypothetical protein
MRRVFALMLIWVVVELLMLSNSNFTKPKNMLHSRKEGVEITLKRIKVKSKSTL